MRKCKRCGVWHLPDRVFKRSEGLCGCCAQALYKNSGLPPHEGWWFDLKDFGSDCMILCNGRPVDLISKVTIICEGGKPTRAVVELASVSVRAAAEGQSVVIKE